jgi:hypothetical protein
VKIRIIPVAAGLSAAAGLAIAGASLANANAGSAPAASASAYAPGQGEPTPPSQGGTPGLAPPHANGNPDPSQPTRDDAKLLIGDGATNVTTAAESEEPGASIERVETDSDGVHEAHVVREDGTPITVLIDENYAVTGVQEGGGPGAPGGGPGPRDGGEPVESSSTT